MEEENAPSSDGDYHLSVNIIQRFPDSSSSLCSFLKWTWSISHYFIINSSITSFTPNAYHVWGNKFPKGGEILRSFASQEATGNPPPPKMRFVKIKSWKETNFISSLSLFFFFSDLPNLHFHIPLHFHWREARMWVSGEKWRNHFSSWCVSVHNCFQGWNLDTCYRVTLLSGNLSLGGCASVTLSLVQPKAAFFLLFCYFFVKCETFFLLFPKEHLMTSFLLDKWIKIYFPLWQDFPWAFDKDKHSQTATPSPEINVSHAIRKILVSIVFIPSLGSGGGKHSNQMSVEERK